MLGWGLGKAQTTHQQHHEGLHHVGTAQRQHQGCAALCGTHRPSAFAVDHARCIHPMQLLLGMWSRWCVREGEGEGEG